MLPSLNDVLLFFPEEKRGELSTHLTPVFDSLAISINMAKCLEILTGFTSTTMPLVWHELRSSRKDFRQLPGGVDWAKAGIHVLRSYFAHMVWNCRHRLDIFDADGIMVINDYLDPQARDNISWEIEPFQLAISKNENNKLINQNYPGLDNLFYKSTMKADVFSCLGHDLNHYESSQQYMGNTFVQKLHNVRGDGDVQKTMHIDTYYPCIKWWYFPEAVRIQDGPFTFAPGSHHLTFEKMQFIYDQSIAINQNMIDEIRTYGHAEGSLRATEQEIADMGFCHTTYAVPANTLLIANTHGFHARGEVNTEAYRNSVHGSIRTYEPFK